jgi:hypothetical protein
VIRPFGSDQCRLPSPELTNVCAGPSDVSRALCSDIERSATITSLETEAYLLAKAYYGWDFVLDPLDDFPAYC